jgi:hypothetical protein
LRLCVTTTATTAKLIVLILTGRASMTASTGHGARWMPYR